jgi:transposase-like protein
MATAKRVRTKYTARKRAEILAAADKEGLSATDVQRRFGVIPVTYYTWRKRVAGPVGGRPRQARGRSLSIEGRARDEVRARLARQIPRIVEEEVGRYLDSMLGPERGKRRS